MKNNSYRNSGISLLIGITLMVLTIILHPVGGDIAHLVKITNIIMISHALGILSILSIIVGFWGVYENNKDNSLFARLGLVATILALISAMIAAAINGFTLPLFVRNYENASPESLTFAKQILEYSFSLNHAFDFIFIAGMCVAIVNWSFAFLRTKSFPTWISYVGFIFCLMVFLAHLLGHHLAHLFEFRIFVLGVALWCTMVGLLAIRK